VHAHVHTFIGSICICMYLLFICTNMLNMCNYICINTYTVYIYIFIYFIVYIYIFHTWYTRNTRNSRTYIIRVNTCCKSNRLMRVRARVCAQCVRARAHACVCARVCAVCARVCVRACAHACVRAHVRKLTVASEIVASTFLNKRGMDDMLIFMQKKRFFRLY